MVRPSHMILVATLASLFACSGDDEKSDDTNPDDVEDTGSSGDTDDTGGATGDWCTDNGYEIQPFGSGPYGTNYGELVEDFTVGTLDGDWTLSENWSGCDNYLFVNYADGYDYPAQLWASDMGDFLEASPPNVHYFFMSYDEGSEEEHVNTIRERLDDALGDMTTEDQEHWAGRLHYVTDTAWYAGSVGVFLQSRGAWAVGIDRGQNFREIGYLADMMRTGRATLVSLTYEARYYDYGVTRDSFIEDLGADSYQSFDGTRVGSGYADLSLPDADTMASYDTMHIELELGCGDSFSEDCGEWDYLIHAYVCSQPEEENSATDIECQPYVPEVMGACLVGGEYTGVECREDVDCEPVEEEVTTDTGSADTGGSDTGAAEPEPVTVTCEAYEGAVAADTLTCGCDEPDGSSAEATQTCNAEGSGYDDCACACNTEIGRWITSYARSGKWVMDASPALAYLKDGGEQKIRFQSSYSYFNTLTFHMTNEGKEGTPDEIHPLFTGGSFNAAYNDRYEPIEVEIPADAKRVELFAVISGHGWGAEVENCAEFCNHTHHFTVNGVEYVKEHPIAGVIDGCVQQIEQGTVPNQFGTWPFGRGGWCPGKQVDPWVVDVTDVVVPGETATVTYRGLFEGDTYVPEASGSGSGFGANINMRSNLVISR